MRAVPVSEPPPAVQLAEGEIHPTQAAKVFQRHQLTRRREQIPTVGERLVQKSGSVQHVGGDQQIVTVGGKSLCDGVLLDIQRTVFDASTAVAEPRLRFCKEGPAEISV